MSNFPQKRSVNVAVASKRQHDLSHYHVGTTDWGIMKPVECRYMVPGDEFNYNVFNETRVLNAMPSPTIGKFDVILRSFFVPINSVWKTFYDFLKNQPAVMNGTNYVINNAPFIILEDFIEGFIADSSLCYETQSQVASDADFIIYQNTQTPPFLKAYCFTRKGRQIINFLSSLGINIPLGTAQSDMQALSTKLYIILPLVCFWKFYFDWVVPSRYVKQHQDYIQYFISKLLDNPNVFASGVTWADFSKYLLHIPYSYYEDDVFTTSTEFPFQSAEDLSSTVDLVNPNNSNTDYFDVDADSNPSLEFNGAYTFQTNGSVFNMYTLQTLGKLQDLLNRNLIAGSKVQDWLLTEFGIRPNNDSLHLSTYLGSKRSGLSISDVLSNADTEAQGGTPLGAYAGYVNNKAKFDFSYKAQEHGFFFITHEIVPRTSYYQGMAAQFDLGDRFDFFQPEFDNQQGAPLPFRRLYFSNNGKEITDGAEFLSRFDAKFGFQLQYADLKYAQDVVSGDFRTRFGEELKSWFLTRDMSYLGDPNNEIAGIDEEFCLVKSQYQDWHYIFSDRNDELDPFLVSFYLQVPALRPMKSIAEGFEPTYKNGGKDVTLDFSGAVK